MCHMCANVCECVRPPKTLNEPHQPKQLLSQNQQKHSHKQNKIGESLRICMCEGPLCPTLTYVYVCVFPYIYKHFPNTTFNEFRMMMTMGSVDAAQKPIKRACFHFTQQHKKYIYNKKHHFGDVNQVVSEWVSVQSLQSIPNNCNSG